MLEPDYEEAHDCWTGADGHLTDINQSLTGLNGSIDNAWGHLNDAGDREEQWCDECYVNPCECE